MPRWTELALDAQPPAALDVARRAHVRQRDAAVVQRAIGREARDALVSVRVGHALVEETARGARPTCSRAA